MMDDPLIGRQESESRPWRMSWFGRRKKKDARGGGGAVNEPQKQVVDGKEIEALVENKAAFADFVDGKFKELDTDGDGQLSTQELRPAVADIGLALGLPPQGSSPAADHIYDEVLNEFTHGKQEKVNKIEFQSVLSDILLGMAAGLKRDPIVILRIDGEDLQEFVDGPRFEPESVSIFSQLENTDSRSLRHCLMSAVQQLTVEHGVPPASDSWVLSNFVEPALLALAGDDRLDRPASQHVFLEEFKRLLKSITGLLHHHPVIVAHTENRFDGSGVRRLLSNKFELDKLLDSAWKEVMKDRNNKTSAEFLRPAFDRVGASAELPPYGAVEEVDAVVDEAFRMATGGGGGGKTVDEEEFKKLLTEVLGSVMLQLEGNHIAVSSNSVVHEPLASSSTILPIPALSSLAPATAE